MGKSYEFSTGLTLDVSGVSVADVVHPPAESDEA
jgi:hypothetical protein